MIYVSVINIARTDWLFELEVSYQYLAYLPPTADDKTGAKQAERQWEKTNKYLPKKYLFKIIRTSWTIYIYVYLYHAILRYKKTVDFDVPSGSLLKTVSNEGTPNNAK